MDKYQSDPKTFPQNRYLNQLVDPSFQGVNRLFALSFENEDYRRSRSNYYLPKVEVKGYNAMIDGEIFFDQRINNDFKMYETGQGDYHTTSCLLDYPYFKEN